MKMNGSLRFALGVALNLGGRLLIDKGAGSVEAKIDVLPLWWYIAIMKVKTSVSLSTEILDQVGRYAAEGERSDFIERALRKYLEFLRRHERNQADLERINTAAAFLNSEAGDALDYQAPF